MDSQKNLYKTFVLPVAVVLGVFTILRTWLQLNHPQLWVTPLISVVAAHFIAAFVLGMVAARAGNSWARTLGIIAVMTLLIRLPIAAVYAMAFAEQWTVAGTDEPVRYITDFTQQTGFAHLPTDSHPLRVFIPTLLFPLIPTSILGTIGWFIGRKKSA